MAVAAEAFDVLRVAREKRVRGLDRDLASCPEVGGAVDGAHAADADLLGNQVAIRENRALHPES